MKKLNTGLAGAAILCLLISLFSAPLRAQVTVTVPASCNVVVAGAGGTTGFGGTVGSGGTVLMSDIWGASGGTFTVNPAGNTLLGWGLLGDLSVDDPTLFPPLPPLQSVGAGITTADLISYNKNLRISEQTPPSLPELARSKGRVTIAYTNPSASCSGSMQFDVFKMYANTGVDSSYVPPIIGPDCWLADEVYTYSVDQIASDNYPDAIGGDEYYWTIIDSGGVDVTSLAYNSADKSSITLQAPNPLRAPYTLTCCFGRANPWDGNAPLATHSTCVTKVVGGQPTAPMFSTAIPTCLNTGLTSFSAAVLPIPGYMYTWAASNVSWLLGVSGSQGENLNVSSMGDEPGTITLTVSYAGCEAVDFVYPVGRNFVAPLAITGDTCVDAGTTHPYTIPVSALNNVTDWTVPVGWTVTPTNGAGSAITLGIPVGTAAGAYTISANSQACPAGVISLTVNVRPATPSIVSGATCVVRNGGSAQVYVSSSSTGATGYSWSYPGGWNCITCASTTAIFVPGGTGTGPANLTVTAIGTNGCNATSAPYPVNYLPKTPDSITVNCWNFGIGGNTIMTVGNRPISFYGTYDVIDPSGVLLTGFSVNNITGIITLTTSATAPAGTYTLQIRHRTTSCGSSSYVNYTFTYGGNGAIIGSIPNPGIGNSDVYYVINAPTTPPSTYQWFVDLVPDGTGSTITLSGNPPGPTQVCVNVMHNGCTTRLCTPGLSHSRMAAVDGDDGRDATMNYTRIPEGVRLFPNPNDGIFTLELPKFKNSASAKMLDVNGREIGQFTFREGQNRISKDNLAAGSYFLLLELDGEVSLLKVQITNK